MPDIANDQHERKARQVGFGVLLYIFFGGEFLGFALYVVGNAFGVGLLVILFYFLGSWALSKALDSQWALFAAFGIGAFVVPVFYLFAAGIADLASNGAYGLDNSGGPYSVAQTLIIGAILWVVFGAPRHAFSMGIDRGGDGQVRTFVIRVCTVLASVLTGAYVLLLHFGGGPLSRVSINALVVGTVFTVFLVAPGYRFVGTRCWELGLVRMFWFSPRGKKSRKAVLTELGEFAVRLNDPESPSRPPVVVTSTQTGAFGNQAPTHKADRRQQTATASVGGKSAPPARVRRKRRPDAADRAIPAGPSTPALSDSEGRFAPTTEQRKPRPGRQQPPNPT